MADDEPWLTPSRIDEYLQARRRSGPLPPPGGYRPEPETNPVVHGCLILVTIAVVLFMICLAARSEAPEYCTISGYHGDCGVVVPP